MDIKINSETALVFDLDDTLYNELDYLKSAYWEICLSVEPKNTLELYNTVFSLYRSQKNPFDYISTLYNISTEELLRQYRNHVPNINPFPEVLKILKLVKEKQGKIAIITDGREVTQMNKLKALNIWHLLDCCIISESFGSEKPNSNNYLEVEKLLRVKDYYYFGDNFKKDFIAPLNLGWKTVGLIDNGKNIHHHNYRYTADPPEFLIQSYSELKII